MPRLVVGGGGGTVWGEVWEGDGVSIGGAWRQSLRQSARDRGRKRADVGIGPYALRGRGSGRPRRAAPTQGWRFGGTNGVGFCGSLAARRDGARPLRGWRGVVTPPYG